MTNFQIPVKVGQKIELTIDSLAAGGEAVGKHEGYTIFVPGGAPGDRLKVEIIEAKKNYGRAKILEILAPSSERINPRCPSFPDCGGCQWQHLSYPAQLKWKKQIVIDSLTRIGGLSSDLVRDTLGMEDPWFYRNKIQYPFGLKGDQIIMGYFRQGTHQVIDLKECFIQHPYLTQIAYIVRDAVRRYKLSVYNEETHQGLLRHFIARLSFKTGEALLGLVINGHAIPYAGRMVEEIVRDVKKNLPARIVGFVQNINTKRGNVILGEKTEALFGENRLMEYLGGLRFQISIESFFQVNPLQAERLYKLVEDLSEVSKKEVVIDAYSGIGCIALWLAPLAREIYGIEEVLEAWEDAQSNAKLNKIKNVTFGCGKVEVLLPDLLKRGVKVEIIILDPPRQGCSPKAIEAVIKTQPKRIVYVSCNPATLARDLKVFTQSGYMVELVQPVDMFPQTFHVEAVATLHP